MKSTMALLLATACAASAVPSPARARQGGAPPPQVLNVTSAGETFPGTGTDDSFPRRIRVAARGESWILDALGSGMRKKLIIKVYEGVAYADTSAGLGADPFAALIDGDFPKRILMHFVHDVDSGKIRGAFEEGFDKTAPEAGRTPELKADLAKFLDYFQGEGVKDGDDIDFIWMPGMGLYTVIARSPKPPIDDPALARALWGIWFGADPVNDGLKRDLVRFVTGPQK